MQTARKTTPFRSIFDAGELKSSLEASGIKPSFMPYIWKHVIQNPSAELDQIPSLPSAAYPLLTSKFKTLTSSVHSATDSSDHLTTKLLIKLQNGALVEAVIMRYDSSLGKHNAKSQHGGARSTLCVSSQVGCKMGCTFCATGTMGFKSNLTSGEIVEQLVHASRISPIRNVVFMGMGEPLNNYNALVEAIRVMTGLPFQLSPRRITVSTVGIIHAINKFHDDLPGLNLAVSLHAPVQEIRCQIMPAARAFPLVKLMDSLGQYQKNSQQKIFIEYIMLDGVNDEEEHAHQLGKLLDTFQVVINLIPFNPIGSLSKFKTTAEDKVSVFQKILRGTYGIRTTVRKEMGQDISGACGQLVVNLPNKRSSDNAVPLTDIEDLQSKTVNSLSRHKSTGEIIVKHLNKEQESNQSNFRDSETNAELEVGNKMSLLEWFANEYKRFGCSLEFVTNKSQEGSQFCRGFGGIGGILRYQLDMRTFDELSEDDEVYDDSE